MRTRPPQFDPYDGALRIWPRRMPAARAVALGAALYCLLHAGVRLVFTDVVAVDWVAHLVEAQSLDLYQNPKYPPAPAWALWLVAQITGPGALATLIVKYGVLAAGFVAFFHAARRVLRHDGWAVFATLSLLGLYQIGWNVHEGVSHTVFLILAAPLTLLAFLELRTRQGQALNGQVWPRLAAYVWFGAAVGLGALAKQSYFIGLAALIAAALAQPGYRAVLLDRRIVISVLVAAALALPHYAAALASGFDFAGAAAGSLARPDLGGRGAQILAGLLATLVAPVLFLSPLLPLLLVTVPRAFSPANLLRPGGHGAAGADPVRLVRDMLAAGLAMMAAAVLVAGVAHYGERWMHPIMLPAPIYLAALVRAAAPPPRRVRALLWVFLALGVLALGWRVAGFVYPDETTCGRCRLAAPYAELAEKISELGFSQGTIIAGDEHIAGNLRAHFPQARVIALTLPYYTPPAPSARSGDQAGRCLIVWRVPAEAPHAPEAPDALDVPRAALATAGLDTLPAQARRAVVTLPDLQGLRRTPWRHSRFGLVLMAGRGNCR